MRNFDLPYSKKKIFFLLFHFTMGTYALYPMLIVAILARSNRMELLGDPRVDLVYSVLLLILSIYLTKDFWIEMGRRFKQEPMMNIKTVFITLPLMLGTSMVLNYAITTLTGLDGSQNQNELIKIFGDFPLLLVFQALIFAPLIEELMYRGLLFGMLQKRSQLFAVLFSSFFFGMAHIYPSLFDGHYMDLVFLPTYFMLGFWLNRAYIKSKSLYAPVIIHFINNAIGVFAIYLSSIL
ncbi:MAG TPA: hypothetical protein DIC19_02075 [Erysipelotrichaceae bacterium]|nr:hypothetical protein [Erysipelotrichaceae bacterium]